MENRVSRKIFRDIYEISIHIFEEEEGSFTSVKTTRVVSPNVTEKLTW